MAPHPSASDHCTVQHVIESRTRVNPAGKSVSLVRILWTTAGTLLLVAGVAGIILPLLPGTVFLLAASACYVRGSARLDRWLTGHRILGRHLRVITGKEAMPLRSKIVALSAMWTAVTLSIAVTSILPLQAGLAMLAGAGTWFITARR